MELGGGSPVQVDFEPSIELAHGYRTADISARARPLDREAPGFENQRRSPRRCAADAQVRTVRRISLKIQARARCRVLVRWLGDRAEGRHERCSLLSSPLS